MQGLNSYPGLSAPRSGAASAQPAPRSSSDLAACPPPSVLADPLNQPSPKPAGQVTLDRGWEGRYGHEQLRFLYLPLAHAEDIALQALSVDRYEALGDPEALKAAREHAEVIRLYGRFPSRNAALARPSTPAEISYLRKRTHRW
ncbi:DUF924 family protein [Methylobacterium sp. Leaf361]|uniref:DUF924 family protein n=1 Tax=Methylobacterium sp. Leaf361 TaxID=1736352 RepID=UPI0009E81753|nr:DUF924 family protein [Methylobacterium sp. Leaf361]